MWEAGAWKITTPDPTTKQIGHKIQAQAAVIVCSKIVQFASGG